MTIDFTVAIPTYNSEHRLGKILERLQEQVGIETLNWQVIIVDNNSQDATAKVAFEYQAKWFKPDTLKYCLEPRQGTAFARNRAVKEASSDLVGLLDDDNLPALNWVASAYKFGTNHPQAGAYASQIYGEFEVEPPQNFERIASFLGITRRGSQAHLYEPDKLILPPGAGLVVRKQAWLESVPDLPILKGRLGKSLVGGEDLEALLHLHFAGWEIWYNPEMETYHQIPSWRLEKDYLVKLAYGVGLNSCCLRMLHTPFLKKQYVLSRTFLGSLRRLFLYAIESRHQRLSAQDASVSFSELISACELAFHWGYFFSPFYFIWLSLMKKITG